MRKLSIFIVALFLLSACSSRTVMQQGKRKPASVNATQATCQNYAVKLMRGSLSDKMPISEQDRLVQESEAFWGKIYRNVERSQDGWWSRQRRKLIRIFQNINDNDFPIYFINDQEETMPKILKAEEYFVKQRTMMNPNDEIGKEALLAVDSWMDRYSSYVEDVNKLLKRFMSLENSIDQLNQLAKNSTSFPSTHEFRFINKNNEYVVEVKEFLNREKLIRFRDILRHKADEIKRGRFFVSGSLQERLLQQAEDQQRLIALYDRLKDLQLTNQARAIDSSDELVSRVERLHKLLFERKDLKPSFRTDHKLAKREFSAELNYLFETLKNKPIVVDGKKFLASLNDNQRRVLKLDSRGRAGEVVSYVKENKVLSLIYAATGISGTAYSLTWVVTQTKDILMSRSEKRMECAKASNSDQQFFDCFQKYLTKRFKLEHPFTYAANGFEGLYLALKNDPQKIEEFKYEFEMFLRVRAKELEAQHREEEFRHQFMQMIDFRLEQQGNNDDKIDEALWDKWQKEDSLPRYKLLLSDLKKHF